MQHSAENYRDAVRIIASARRAYIFHRTIVHLERLMLANSQEIPGKREKL